LDAGRRIAVRLHGVSVKLGAPYFSHIELVLYRSLPVMLLWNETLNPASWQWVQMKVLDGIFLRTPCCLNSPSPACGRRAPSPPSTFIHTRWQDIAFIIASGVLSLRLSPKHPPKKGKA